MADYSYIRVWGFHEHPTSGYSDLKSVVRTKDPSGYRDDEVPTSK